MKEKKSSYFGIIREIGKNVYGIFILFLQLYELKLLEGKNFKLRYEITT